MLVIVIFIIATSVRILREYERAVIFRLGRSARAMVNPGGQGHGQPEAAGGPASWRSWRCP